MTEDKLFKTKTQAKASPTKLLKVMDEYKDDEFSLVEIIDWKLCFLEYVNR